MAATLCFLLAQKKKMYRCSADLPTGLATCDMTTRSLWALFHLTGEEPILEPLKLPVKLNPVHRHRVHPYVYAPEGVYNNRLELPGGRYCLIALSAHPKNIPGDLWTLVDMRHVPTMELLCKAVVTFVASAVKGYTALLSRPFARLILGDTPPSKELNSVDHIDRNPLNNTVENLRWATQLKNQHKKRVSTTHPEDRCLPVGIHALRRDNTIVGFRCYLTVEHKPYYVSFYLHECDNDIEATLDSTIECLRDGQLRVAYPQVVGAEVTAAGVLAAMAKFSTFASGVESR